MRKGNLRRGRIGLLVTVGLSVDLYSSQISFVPLEVTREKRLTLGSEFKQTWSIRIVLMR